jgi:hypothetical protein
MTKVHVTAKRDHLESIATARPLAALAELVWNGFDAGSNEVRVCFDLNSIGIPDTIRVQDFGDGIVYEEIEKYFGNLGESWKKNKGRHGGRALHGKSGKGRFKAFALGTLVEWVTTYKKEAGSYTYKIIGSAQSLEDFEIVDLKASNGAACGTEVIISNLRGTFPSLVKGSASHELAKVFAAYLTEYPNLKLQYDGQEIDPKSAQAQSNEYDLGQVTLESGVQVPASVAVIEWKIPTDRAVHLCDSKGISLQELDASAIRAPGFHFTAYVKADHFRELDKQNILGVSEMHADVALILKAAKNKIKQHFRRRFVENQSKIIQQWKEEKIYPYIEKNDLSSVELAERQVFDILAVNVQSYLPSFDESDSKAKKFTFQLLAQAIKENPDSLQSIISEVLGLKKEEQDELAELLRKTTLSSIISSAKIVADRLNFLVALEGLVFSESSKKQLLERDQLHKILEKESWLFDENFSLAGSEQGLDEVLQKHLEFLGKREDDPDPVLLPDGKTGRVDLFFHKAIQPRAGEYDYLVVELKRPSRKIDADVITQIKKYAYAVAADERFQGVNIRWKFLAVSNDFDGFAKNEAQQHERPRGLIATKDNTTVWIKTWAEVINDARARLNFVNKYLLYEADRDTAKAYLKKTHEKFIPVAESNDHVEEENDGDGRDSVHL